MLLNQLHHHRDSKTTATTTKKPIIWRCALLLLFFSFATLVSRVPFFLDRLIDQSIFLISKTF